MALKPLGDAVFVEVIYHQPDEELLDDFNDAVSEFDLGSSQHLTAALETEKRRIEASISKKEPQSQQGDVIAVGPDCRELEVGDYVIFPLYSGSMVTLLNEATGKYQRVFVLSEIACLARYREE